MMEEKDKDLLQIYFSYAAQDMGIASRLRALLSQRQNLKLFTTDSLSAGENWISKMKKALSSCDIFIVLFSNNSIDSPWVLHELGAAWALEKPIIPVLTSLELISSLPVALSENRVFEIKDIENVEALNQILEHYEKEAATSQEMFLTT